MAAARAFLSGGRVGDELERLNAIRARVRALFAKAGAQRVEPETLQPAELLLDLYGEDIRGRAFVVHDPAAGELCLRPDFTVPVARVHMEEGADPARYAYEGLVWRRQDPGSDRPTEYLQAGIELIGGDAAADDAEIFTLIREALGDLAGPVVTGDLGVIFAAINGLRTSAARKAALRRHVWRPARFQELLERYAAPPAPSAHRRALLAADEKQLARMIGGAGRFVGLRSAEEIAARAAVLRDEAATPPLSAEEKTQVEALLAVKCPAGEAPARLRALGLPDLGPAIYRMERRLAALERRGADLSMPYDAAFGRALEYYDGFVFEFRAKAPGLPPLGGGGRYDALTAVLGAGKGSTAVGGVVRPEAMAAAEAMA